MMKKHYLSKKEREEIAANLSSNRLYKHLRSVALRADALTEYFSLSGEDLLYHTVFSIDSLLECLSDSEEEAILYCGNLYQELRMHFSENVECREEDMSRASILVVETVFNLLFIHNHARYWKICDALRAGAEEGNQNLREEIKKIITDVFYEETVAQDLKCWMQDYVCRKDCFSDYIDQIIEESRSTTELTGIDNQEEIEDQLKDFFWNDKEKAEEFLFKIYGKNDQTIIEIIAELITPKKKKMGKGNKTKLWKILHDNCLYQASKTNFSDQLRKKGW